MKLNILTFTFALVAVLAAALISSSAQATASPTPDIACTVEPDSTGASQ